MCREPATHKVGEELFHDDPNPYRHNLTAYVCCWHFGFIMKTVCHPLKEGAMSQD